MRKYERKSDVSSRPFRTNIVFPCVFQSKTEKTEKKEAEEEEDDEDEDGDDHNEDEDDDAKI